ncbi:hypothetical protein CSC12_0812 [Klebsiella michiganensis]|nr:hypothetical protein CSC12_0812 [Klebsiella michiganensis]
MAAIMTGLKAEDQPVHVDDATSKIMELLFVKSEPTFSYFEATRHYIDKHGKPLALVTGYQLNGGCKCLC